MLCQITQKRTPFRGSRSIQDITRLFAEQFSYELAQALFVLHCPPFELFMPRAWYSYIGCNIILLHNNTIVALYRFVSTNSCDLPVDLSALLFLFHKQKLFKLKLEQTICCNFQLNASYCQYLLSCHSFFQRFATENMVFVQPAQNR